MRFQLGRTGLGAAAGTGAVAGTAAASGAVTAEAADRELVRDEIDDKTVEAVLEAEAFDERRSERRVTASSEVESDDVASKGSGVEL